MCDCSSSLYAASNIGIAYGKLYLAAMRYQSLFLPVTELILLWLAAPFYTALVVCVFA